jgi:serine/threonine-protein phosphatase 2A regulatory subunit A
MKDPIYTIREAALINFKQLTVIFGEQWAIKQIFPPLFKNQNEESYLHRLTTLFGMTILGD